jgi:hypothetical protein
MNKTKLTWMFVACTLIGGICGDCSLDYTSMAFFGMGTFFGVTAFLGYIE